jgi:hypothetical protein
VAEVNLMERQLLCLLDFQLRLTEEEVCAVLHPLMCAPSPSDSRGTRLSIGFASMTDTEIGLDQEHASSSRLLFPQPVHSNGDYGGQLRCVDKSAGETAHSFKNSSPSLNMSTSILDSDTPGLCDGGSSSASSSEVASLSSECGNVLNSQLDVSLKRLTPAHVAYHPFYSRRPVESGTIPIEHFTTPDAVSISASHHHTTNTFSPYFSRFEESSKLSISSRFGGTKTQHTEHGDTATSFSAMAAGSIRSKETNPGSFLSRVWNMSIVKSFSAGAVSA